MYIILLCVLIIVIIIILFIIKLSNKSNSVEDNILLNKINDLENDNQNSLDLFNNHASYRLGDAVYLLNNENNWTYDKDH